MGSESSAHAFVVRPGTSGDDVASWWKDHWGDGVVAVHDRVFTPAEVRVVVAEGVPASAAPPERLGLATYVVAGSTAEIVSIDAVVRRQGVGSALVGEIVRLAREAGATRLVLTTTNDNLDALGFWQSHGFRLTGLRPGAVDDARRAKPAIPTYAANGLPIRDELDLMLDLS